MQSVRWMALHLKPAALLGQVYLFHKIGDKTLGGVRLKEKKYHFHLGHHNENSFVGKIKGFGSPCMICEPHWFLISKRMWFICLFVCLLCVV